MEIAQKDKKLRRFVVAHGENMKELLDYVRFIYESNCAHLLAINAARTMMKDIGDDVASTVLYFNARLAGRYSVKANRNSEPVQHPRTIEEFG